MTRLLLLFALLSSFSAPAQAQGPLRKMGWGDSADDYDHHNSSPSCGAMPDKSKLVVSFVAPAGVNKLEKVFGYVDLCTKPYPVLPWWTFSPFVGCRSDSLSANAGFSAGPFSRTDPWGGRGQTTFTYGASPGGSWEMARITVEVTATPGAPIALVANQEYYAFQIEFGNPDVGCGGCEYPACFVLNGLLIYHDGGLIEPTTMDYYSNYCRWQGGQSDCPFIVPAINTSWGRVKETYR